MYDSLSKEITRIENYTFAKLLYHIGLMGVCSILSILFMVYFDKVSLYRPVDYMVFSAISLGVIYCLFCGFIGCRKFRAETE